MSLRTSTPDKEGNYQGSKFLKFQVLCDSEELKELFSRMGTFWIYPLTGLNNGEAISQETFLREHTSWIETLQRGEVPTDATLRKVLACAITSEEDALWKQEVPGGRFLVKIAKPVIQVQAHYFTYSSIDGVFRPMTMGEGSISWGLQFSYPQIYQEPKTMALLEADEEPNAALFQTIRQWTRDCTRATPFIVDGSRINVPIRLGKNCFPWIHKHPQLIAKGIGVHAG
jgi:hypothetical protein